MSCCEQGTYLSSLYDRVSSVVVCIHIYPCCQNDATTIFILSDVVLFSQSPFSIHNRCRDAGTWVSLCTYSTCGRHPVDPFHMAT